MTDIEISNNCKLKKINRIAKKFKIKKNNLIFFGDYKAKLKKIKINNKNKNLILVTATNPTKFGEGKTTVSIGLADAMNMLNKKTVLALREPSLGPVFGTKGGATGGGYSQIVPMDDINLHFNGDFHAITVANNLLCAMIDNSIYFGNPLDLDLNKINFHRCLDVNDRALRNIELNIENKIKRPEKFNITAASEMMSILTLTKNLDDLKNRINNICIGFNTKNQPVYAKELGCTDSIAVLLKDAINPNIVQTLKGGLAIVHLGPFANISHGCNSVVATQTALSLGDYAVTEAGFGADLGAQKFFDVVCKQGGYFPSCTVLVTTIRSLKYNGGVNEDQINEPNIDGIKNGLKLLIKHYENLTEVYKQNVVVALNKFPSDTMNELGYVKTELNAMGICCEICNPYMGAEQCLDLAKAVILKCKNKVNKNFAYMQNDSILEKINKIAKNIYGAKKVVLSEQAKEKIKLIEKNNLSNLDVVIAKTQYSLSDNPKLLGCTCGFEINISDVELHSGAGYVVALAGKMLLMPGLSKQPNAVNIKIKNNKITGLF